MAVVPAARSRDDETVLGKDAVEELIARGWIRLPGYLSPAVLEELRPPESIAWVPLAPKVGVVEQRGAFAQSGFDEAPAAVQQAGVAIHEAVVSATGRSLVPRFNEVTWQRYGAGEGFIDPHRDQPFYVGVIAIITLAGEADFAILESREPPVVLEQWRTAPGDLVLLRGAELAGPDSRGPLHRVNRPISERVTLTLRHNLGGVGGGWSDG